MMDDRDQTIKHLREKLQEAMSEIDRCNLALSKTLFVVSSCDNCSEKIQVNEPKEE